MLLSVLCCCWPLGSVAFYIFIIGDGFEHLRASVALLTGAVCIDLPPFESCHVRLSDAEWERDKWKSRGNKTAFCLDKGLFHPPKGFLIKCLFPCNEYLEGMSIWPSKQVHKGRATSRKHNGQNKLFVWLVKLQSRPMGVFLDMTNVLRKFSLFMHRH